MTQLQLVKKKCIKDTEMKKNHDKTYNGQTGSSRTNQIKFMIKFDIHCDKVYRFLVPDRNKKTTVILANLWKTSNLNPCLFAKIVFK
jgi:hypothetical protein